MEVIWQLDKNSNKGLIQRKDQNDYFEPMWFILLLSVN